MALDSAMLDSSMLKLVPITDDYGVILQVDWLARAETIHRQLRPRLPNSYVDRLQQVFANGGRMLVATQNHQVLGLAVWRLIENTYEGRRLYVDDLVVNEQSRSQGVGKALLMQLEAYAKELICDVLALDSGTQRTRAHAFYFREGMHVPAFCFKKEL